MWTKCAVVGCENDTATPWLPWGACGSCKRSAQRSGKLLGSVDFPIKDGFALKDPNRAPYQLTGVFAGRGAAARLNMRDQRTAAQKEAARTHERETHAEARATKRAAAYARASGAGRDGLGQWETPEQTAGIFIALLLYLRLGACLRLCF